MRHSAGLYELEAMWHLFQIPRITMLPGGEGGGGCDQTGERCQIPHKCVPMQKTAFERDGSTHLKVQNQASYSSSVMVAEHVELLAKPNKATSSIMFVFVKRGDSPLFALLMPDGNL